MGHTMQALFVVIALVALLTLGWLIGHPVAVLLFAVIALGGWHAWSIRALRRWLKNPDEALPQGIGPLGTLFEDVQQLVSQGMRKKEEYSAMIEDFQLLADAYPDATLLLDGDDRLLWFNAAARTSFKFDDQKHVGSPIAEMVPIPGVAEWLEQENAPRIQIPWKRLGNRQAWLECSRVPIRNGKHLVIFRDMTHVHETERIRRDFVTNVSHELRTPLTVMLGYLEVFLDRQPDDVGDAMARMHAQAVQMQAMLNDFLELSRLQSLDTDAREAEVYVPGLLAGLRKQAEEISRGEHHLEFEIEDDLNLRGVSEDIESAFRNLIVNALKYTPEGGTITVRWFESDGAPILEVIDTGIGIPAREIPRLTERFYRVGSDRGRKSGGTGLGLAIVKHVMNAHGARLEIKSEYGSGSMFRCLFPPERAQNR